MTEELRPKKLTAGIGGYFGITYSIEWKNNHLLYVVSEKRKNKYNEIVLVPKQEEWEEFWVELNKINAWKWKDSYDDSRIVDGTSWDLEIDYNGKHIETSGSNDYPPNFEDFLAAVEKLIKNDFR